MDDRASTVGDTLELLHLNQVALRAVLEELPLWVSHRGSTITHENVMTALVTLDTHAEAISAGIKRLRS